MKLRYWLMGVFLVVMVLPLCAVLILYNLVSDYDERRAMEEYIQASQKLKKIEQTVMNLSLYHVQSSEAYAEVTELTSDSIQIILYRYDGAMLYSSQNMNALPGFYTIKPESLYRNLYDLRISHRTYTLKKPVWKGSELLGFYEIVLSRTDWMNAVNHKTKVVAGAGVLFVVILYGGVLLLLRWKLFQPTRLLMSQMSAFASGRSVPETTYRSTDEMGQLLHHFYDMRRTIDQTRAVVAKQQREKEMMVAALSHDLKTPLTSIGAYAEALGKEQRLTEAEKYEYYNVISDKIALMKNMLGDLQVYASLQSMDINKQMVDVEGEEFFEMLLGGYSELCARSGVRLEVNVDTNNRSYHVHPSQMMRLIDNLVSNALRHTYPLGGIGLAAIAVNCPLPSWVFEPFRKRLEVLRTSGTLLLVQNEGESIAAEDIEILFEPFIQNEVNRKLGQSGSLGLGLSIARGIMDKHEGSIQMWSLQGYGTIVVCVLPE